MFNRQKSLPEEEEKNPQLTVKEYQKLHTIKIA